MEVWKKSDKIVSMVLMLRDSESDMGMWSTEWRAMAEKQQFYEELECEWNLISNAEMILSLRDFTEHVENKVINLKTNM